MRTTQIVADRIHAYFGRRRKVMSAEALEKIARDGVPAEVGAGGNLGSELAYGNHKNALKHRGEVLEKAAMDVSMGRTIVLPAAQAQEVEGLRISPVGVVEEREKLQVIDDLTFGGQANVREKRGGGRRGPVTLPESRLVNADTDWQKVPECQLAGVMMEVIIRILGLRAKYGTQTCI